MKKFTAITCFLIVCLIAAACGDFSDSGDRVRISISINPQNSGTVLSSGGDEIGNQVEFFAVPNPGWEFAGWSGDQESFDNPLTFTLDGDVRLTANFALFRNDYRFDMVLTDQQTSVELKFGQIPGATDFYDSGTDLEAPPSPPGDVLHAWFEGNDRKLLWDYRNAFSAETVWDLQFENGVGDSLWIEWERDIESLTGVVLLTDADGNELADMTEENSIVIHKGEVPSLRILYMNE